MKEFKSLDEQIALLKRRGMIIPDEERAKLYLLTNNYYNIINGYSKYFPCKGDRYTSHTTFDEVTHLYLFDKEIKQSFLNAILTAESHLKAIFAYRFAEKYQNIPYAYLNINCYDQTKILSVGSTIAKLSNLINWQKKYSNTSIYHYVQNHNDVPIWVLVNFLDFGELRYMISASPTYLQNAVAKDLGNFIKLHIQSPSTFEPETMMSFIENINDVRNVCAHSNRLIGFSCRRDSIYWNSLHDKFSISPTMERRSVFSVLLSLQCFLTVAEYGTLQNKIRKLMKRLFNCLHTIAIDDILSRLGFPAGWFLKVPTIKY